MRSQAETARGRSTSALSEPPPRLSLPLPAGHDPKLGASKFHDGLLRNAVDAVSACRFHRRTTAKRSERGQHGSGRAEPEARQPNRLIAASGQPNLRMQMPRERIQPCWNFSIRKVIRTERTDDETLRHLLNVPRPRHAAGRSIMIPFDQRNFDIDGGPPLRNRFQGLRIASRTMMNHVAEYDETTHPGPFDCLA